MRAGTFAIGLVLTVAAVWTTGARPVAADTGVAIDIGKIEVEQRLSRGGTYTLPSIGVRNPGTEATRYRMGVGYFEEQSGERAPESWFTFDPPEVSLEPGETGRVTVELRIPVGARPDNYEALLQAAIVTQGDGTSVGAAAAAQLSFTVKPSNLLQAWQLKVENFVDDRAPWSYVVPGLAVAAGAAWWLRRRFTISIGRRQ